MTAQHVTDALSDPQHAVDAAREHVEMQALTPTPVGRVGLELEFHLVDRRHPERRPEWPTVQALVAGLPSLPSRSRVTVEPGGQIELSTPPADDVVGAVAALRADTAVLRRALATSGHGVAALGADPARPLRRVNPGDRYAAMEQHFDGVGCSAPGRAMMTATAALQVNLDAGPESAWSDRLHLVNALVPVLVALSASSPFLAGRSSGWASMREQAWHGIDPARSAAIPTGNPTDAWAEYALAAPVMLIRDGAQITPVTQRVPFAAWLRDGTAFGRRPTLADLDYHLTTLFPPVRPRGYLEIRCLDALPDRWWPGLAAITALLVDDPVAADAAAEACAKVRDTWSTAGRDGLSNPAIAAAARACVEAAAARCPAPLAAEVQSFAAAVLDGPGPVHELRERALANGPVSVLAEEADV